MKWHNSRLALILACLIVSGARAADTPTTAPVRNTKEYNVSAEKLAIQGYDPVSYFKGGPAEGSEKITLTVDGVIYRFVDDGNRKVFAADPEKYKPAYGGWCATAMAEGNKIEIDPKNYKITHGRLFLFFKAWYANALNAWNKDEKNLTSKADVAWKKIAGE